MTKQPYGPVEGSQGRSIADMIEYAGVTGGLWTLAVILLIILAMIR